MGDLRNIALINPWYLLLFVPLFIFIIYKHFIRKKYDSNLVFSTVSDSINIKSIRSIIYKLIPIFQYLGAALLIIAIARPQQVLKEEEVKAEGIDIFMVMDLSSSMLARDFEPDRLEVSKRVATEFVGKRQYDRLGLVVFAGEAFTQCPLTTDHWVVKQFLSSLKCGVLEDGTAIGMGLATAINRLEGSEAKSKVIILLTDGVNNKGYVKPMTAAEIAQQFNVKVYTIGVGSAGEALIPISRKNNGDYIFGVSRVELDEKLLKEISELTGGKYYRALSKESLEAIYAEIDELEKTELNVTVFKRYKDLFHHFLLIGLILFLTSFILSHTLIRSLP